jgi:hypothetical protein
MVHDCSELYTTTEKATKSSTSTEIFLSFVTQTAYAVMEICWLCRPNRCGKEGIECIEPVRHCSTPCVQMEIQVSRTSSALSACSTPLGPLRPALRSYTSATEGQVNVASKPDCETTASVSLSISTTGIRSPKITPASSGTNFYSEIVRRKNSVTFNECA